MDTHVEATPEYSQLFNTLLAGELTINTNRIMITLEEENNNIPFEEIKPEVEKGHGVFVETNKDKIRANVLDKGNERVLYVDMVLSDKNQDGIPISQETYTKLKELALDPEVCTLNVKTKLEKAK